MFGNEISYAVAGPLLPCSMGRSCASAVRAEPVVRMAVSAAAVRVKVMFLDGGGRTAEGRWRRTDSGRRLDHRRALVEGRGVDQILQELDRADVQREVAERAPVGYERRALQPHELSGLRADVVAEALLRGGAHEPVHDFAADED